MRRRWHYLTRRNDKAGKGFGRDKGAAAVDICALMIALFCRVREIAASASVGGVVAFWAVKHDEHLLTFPMQSFYPT
jgi:hypothetical protein